VQIDWPAFTPGSAVLGGLLIGAAAVLFALSAGRIAGISGIIGGFFRPRAGDIAWRVAFIAGMLATPALYEILGGRMSIEIDASTATLVVAGLLVGWGTRAGSGCTSGHGVCGLARRSPRSLVATLFFMAAGFLTVFVVRHLVS
jgi:uncharacterized protein